MGIWDKLRGELIDIIEWIDDTRDTMVYRFARYDNEIKYGAKLVVRESQVAAFVNEGRLADVYSPGTYTLETQNMPILSTLRGWKYGFNSPFKAEVYFISTRAFTGRKWGTKNPIMLRDSEFGPVRLRAFGTYGIKVSDPGTFLKQFVGTDGRFTVDELGDQLRDMVVARFTDILGESKIPALDLAANQDELGKFVSDRMTAMSTRMHSFRQPTRWSRRRRIHRAAATRPRGWAWGWDLPWRIRWPARWGEHRRAERGWRRRRFRGVFPISRRWAGNRLGRWICRRCKAR